ncbi:MAG: glutathione peroxidase [Rhodoferax sp.]|nr:glutathione peroxidase [Rhodoferax sp.]
MPVIWRTTWQLCQRYRLILLWLLSALTCQAQAGEQIGANGCPAILSHSFNRLQDEAPQDLCQFAGKVVLIVNTASYCGFTGQYEGLEALYSKYQARGLVVLGFPTNDFGKQEPGSNKEIADFCFNTYAVKFPMFAKTVVTGTGRNALYSQLVKATGTTPKWNFYKYLVDRSGKVVNSYNSMTSPQSSGLVADIEKLL